jgi:hypothetical protein
MPDDPRAVLFSRWTSAWSELRLTPPSGVLDELLARWSEPHRAIYGTPLFGSALEARARSNLERSVQRLRQHEVRP